MVAIIHVRVDFEAFHNWDAAPEHRQYLSSPHLHLFQVTVACPVGHADRDIEFHDMQATLKDQLMLMSVPYKHRLDLRTFGGRSCEHIAEEILGRVPEALSVTVKEDDYVGATVSRGGLHDPRFPVTGHASTT